MYYHVLSDNCQYIIISFEFIWHIRQIQTFFRIAPFPDLPCATWDLWQWCAKTCRKGLARFTKLRSFCLGHGTCQGIQGLPSKLGFALVATLCLAQRHGSLGQSNPMGSASKCATIKLRKVLEMSWNENHTFFGISPPLVAIHIHLRWGRCEVAIICPELSRASEFTRNTCKGSDVVTHTQGAGYTQQ